MSNVVNFPEPITSEHHFGGCPHCGDTDGYLNAGPEHWFVCDQHRTKWRAGANLFSCWRDEDDAMWRKNEYLLGHYRRVKPLHTLSEESARPSKPRRMSAECKTRWVLSFGPAVRSILTTGSSVA